MITTDKYSYINYIENGKISLNIETLIRNTKNDKYLRKILNFVLTESWPDIIKDYVKPYIHKMSKLTVEYNILMSGY